MQRTDPRVQQEVQRFIRLLVDGDYAAAERVTSSKRLSALEIQTAILDYGRPLVAPPDHAWALMSAIRVRDADMPTWSVVMPLWTKEEGRSDLSIELTITLRGDRVVMTCDDIHVL